MTDVIRHRFAAGSGTAIVGPSGAALVASRSDNPIVAKLRNHLLGGNTFAQLVESLLQSGLDGLAPFAVLSGVDGGHRLLIRGDVHVEVSTGGGVDRLSGANLTVWREESYAEVESIVFRVGDAGELEFELDTGVVPAAALAYTTTDPQASPPALAASTPAPEVPAPPALSALEEPVVEEEPDQAAERVEVPEPEMSEPATSEPETSEPEEPEPEPLEVVASTPDVAPPDSSTAFDAGDADSEHTVIRQPAPTPEPTPDTSRPAPPPVEPVPGLISGRPQHFGSAETPPPADADPDHDGRTEIRRPTEAAPVAPTPSPTSTGDLGPTVHAITCPQGHPNPVTQGRCRQCDVEIIERASVTIPRPPLGVLRFSNNEVVDLDGPIAIGRMPPSDAIDGVAPQVIAIDNSELSRFHALIVVDEWFVYVADQGSTNETSVIAPGRAPITCRAHDRVLVPPGAVINLGGAVTCRFDVI